MKRLLLIVLAACNGPATTTKSPLALQSVSVAENPLNVLSYVVEWRTGEDASTEVAVDCGADHMATITGSSGQSHKVLVMGLLAGAHCTITARSVTTTREGSRQESIDVAALPSWLPTFTMKPANTAAMQPGWTLFPLSNGTDRLPLALVIVDELGRVRWYHRRAIAKPGEATEVRATADGLLTTGEEVRSALIGWDGKVVWEHELFAHHEIVPLASDRYLLVKGHADCPGGKWSDTVFEWDQAMNVERWSWRICDYYTPPVMEDDWSHTNAVAPFPAEDALLISLRNQSNLIKIDRATKQRQWVLGDNGDFTLPANARFLRQHAARVLDNGHILLFDNGLAGVREYSRALELSYDVAAKTVAVVWEYRPSPDIFAKVWSDAERLDGGNTLVTFGVEGVAADVTHVIEVDAAKNEVWHLTMPPKWGAYRSHRIAPLTGVELR